MTRQKERERERESARFKALSGWGCLSRVMMGKQMTLKESLGQDGKKANHVSTRTPLDSSKRYRAALLS